MKNVNDISEPVGSQVLPGIWITQLEPARGGRTVAVKDLFDTEGIRTTYGSAVFRDHVPTTTAAAVKRLEAAGWANAGKANLHEFAWGITSENEHYGWVPNPIAPGRTPGGSSGGSAAAVAAGLTDIGLGTDSGGSIRIPAACCGLTGFKPTHGVVPMEGCFPLAPSYDHAGPIARDVAGCMEALAALAPEIRPTEIDVRELRVGIAWTDRAQPLVCARVLEAAEFFPGARPVDLPLHPAEAYPVFQREVAAVHESLWREHRSEYGENVATKLEWAYEVSDATLQAALRERERYHERLAAAMDGLDLVLTPTLTTVAPEAGIGDLALRQEMVLLTLPWNSVGAPALALPCGAAELGLPASVQLVGPPGSDALVLAAGRSLEALLQAR